MNIYHHTPRRLMALLLALVLCIGMVPSAFAAQEDNYTTKGREQSRPCLLNVNRVYPSDILKQRCFLCHTSCFHVFEIFQKYIISY